MIKDYEVRLNGLQPGFLSFAKVSDDAIGSCKICGDDR